MFPVPPDAELWYDDRDIPFLQEDRKDASEIAFRQAQTIRTLVDAGASVFTVPAAFTAVTGEAHWHTLLRARAIENLSYVIAPGQWGTHPDNRATYGHSLIVDPWGRVIAEQAEGNCAVVAEIDPDEPGKLRSSFPALANRRLQE